MHSTVWLALLLSPCTAQDWPRFRGPNGSGVGEAPAPPVNFGADRNLRWRTPVPFGRSSPVVGGGSVFLTASENGRLITLSIGLARGGVRWRRELEPRHRHQIYKANDAASPSPATDGSNVYVFFADYGLVSYAAGGRERWRVALGPFENFYGMGGSPVIVGRTLLIVCDQRKGSFLLALDKDTGRERWRADRGYVQGESYSTPIVRGDEVIVPGSGRVDAYSVATGERSWFARAQGYNAKGTPVLHKDLVIVSSPGSDEPVYPSFGALDADSDGRVTQAELDRHEDLRGHFGAVDADHNGWASPEEWAFMRNLGVGDYGMCAIRGGGAGDVTARGIAWRNKRNYPNVPAPLVYGGILYAVRNGGIVTSYDPLTGAVLHSARAGSALGDFYASPVAAGGQLYLANEEGKIAVLKAGAKFETLAVNDLGEECYATPALAPGSIVVRTARALYRFSAGQ